MNNYLKVFLVILNLIISGIAIDWLIEEKSHEPVITLISSLLALFGILLERPVTNIFTKDIVGKSEIKIKAKNAGEIKTENIQDSKVDIKA